MRVEDQYTDVLQNIEFGVISTFRQHPDLTDFDVETVYNALIQYYKGKQSIDPCQQQRTDERKVLCEAVKAMCDLRLGETEVKAEDGGSVPTIVPISSEEMVICLKRLQKSVQKWTKQGGRQGYLNFVGDFVK